MPSSRSAAFRSAKSFPAAGAAVSKRRSSRSGQRSHGPALDNTFDHPERREPQMREVRNRLAQRVPDGNLVLMTHGVNIQALTGISPAPAELILVRPGTSLEVVGRLGPTE